LATIASRVFLLAMVALAPPAGAREIAGSGMKNRIFPEFYHFIDKLIAAPV
jgi:hypothetical protein